MRDVLTQQDGASFVCFQYMLENAQHTGRLSVVDNGEVNELNPSKPHQVLPRRSVACSCGDMASYGAFDRHAFVLVRNRVIPFAPLAGPLTPLLSTPGGKGVNG